MALKDKKLERIITETLYVLERQIDAIGPTPLRHKLSELVVEARMQLRSFDQADFEKLN